LSTEGTPTSSLSVALLETTDTGREKFRRNLADITRQSSIFLLGSSFTLVAGYLFRIYVARELGAGLLGWNALGMSLYALCKLLGQMGLPQTALRYVAAYSGTKQLDRLRAFFWRALSWTVAGTSLLCVVVFLLRDWIASRIFHAPGFASYLPLFAILIPIGASSAFLNQTLCGFRKVSRSTTITNFVSFPFMILLTVVGLGFGLSLWAYVAAQVAAETLTLILVAFSLNELIPPAASQQEFQQPALQHDVRWFAAAMFGISILEFILGQADRLIVGFYLEAKLVGIYAVASSATAVIPIVLQSVNSIFGPTIANIHAQGEHQVLSRLFQTLTKWVLGLTFPLILLFVVWSRSLMGLFGPEFQTGWPLLVVLSLGQAINCGTGSVGYLLLMSGHQKEIIRAQAVFGFFLLVADFALIRTWGVMAAATVSALGFAISNLYYLWTVRRVLKLFPYNRGYLKLLGPAAATGGMIWAVQRLPALHTHSGLPGILIALVLGYSVFLAGSFLFGLDDDDRMLIRVTLERLSAMLAR
jgi:O-antigen/teichoic acid export membrane protein